MSENEKTAYIDLYGKQKKILSIFESTTGWRWFVTKQTKTTNIWEAFVEGIENEFGSVYKHELLNSPDIYEVPKSEWHNYERVIFK
ncbi:MAG: hypothetical protein K0S93_30 [Nitrososphaeraceae archaeon]|jgi:hypothetical protein|nr:hypothetical protein [Nitrososphaeraceae archaeon]